MNQEQQAELIDLLMKLHPSDQVDVMQFIHMRRLAQLAAQHPPSAQEWERLTPWQRRMFCFQVQYYLVRTQALQSIRSMPIFRKH